MAGTSACISDNDPALVVGDLTYTEADLATVTTQWRVLNQAADAPTREQNQADLIAMIEQRQAAQAEGDLQTMAQIDGQLEWFTIVNRGIAKPHPTVYEAASDLAIFGIVNALLQMGGEEMAALDQATLAQVHGVPDDQAANLPEFTLATRQALTSRYFFAADMQVDPNLVPANFAVLDEILQIPGAFEASLEQVWVAPRIGTLVSDQGLGVIPDLAPWPWLVRAPAANQSVLP